MELRDRYLLVEIRPGGGTSFAIHERLPDGEERAIGFVRPHNRKIEASIPTMNGESSEHFGVFDDMRTAIEALIWMHESFEVRIAPPVTWP